MDYEYYEVVVNKNSWLLIGKVQEINCKKVIATFMNSYEAEIVCRLLNEEYKNV